MLDSDEDEKSLKISLATITCTRKTRKEEESRVHDKVIDQKEVQPFIVRYTPPHLRKKCYVQESLKNILSNGKTFQKKIHHGSPNNSSDNTHHYPCFEDKAKS